MRRVSGAFGVLGVRRRGGGAFRGVGWAVAGAAARAAVGGGVVTSGESGGPPRLAVVAPYAARYLLHQLQSGVRVTSATVREHAAWLRGTQCRPDLAAQVEMSWAQLRASAAAHSAGVDGEGAVEVGGPPMFVVEHGAANIEAADASSGEDRHLTTREVADMLGITPQHVGRLIVDGTLSARRAGRSWLVDRVSAQSLADLRSAS